jgi:hypothetical protein
MGQKTGTSRIRKNVRKKAMAVILVAEYLLQKEGGRKRGKKEGGERGGRKKGEKEGGKKEGRDVHISGQNYRAEYLDKYTAIRYVI